MRSLFFLFIILIIACKIRNMNTKEIVGKRIATARKAAGLTLKELAKRTDLIISRISNWEQGTRSPALDEIIQLANVLNVVPAYLLGLSDITKPEQYFEKKIIPILSTQEASQFETWTGEQRLNALEEMDCLIVDTPVSDITSLFAIKMEDNSLSPEFSLGDAVIINTQLKPSPSQYVLVQLEQEDKPLLRKYRVMNDSVKKQLTVEFVPLNPDWPTYAFTDIQRYRILGVCVEHRRYHCKPAVSIKS
jgi:transcriptional regulator with XRE-family HTH domain